MRGNSLGLILLVIVAVTTVQAAAVEPPPPTVDQLKQLLGQEKYQDVLRGVARCLTLKGPAAQNYDRYDLLMLRGEAYLRSKALPPAAEAFAAAQKETTDPARQSAARADEILVKKSKPQGYLPKPTATSKPAAIPIIDEADRKAALAALLNDEMTSAAPKVKAANAATALPPIIDVARTLGDLRALELAAAGAGGSADQVKKIGADLGDHAHTLIDDALKQVNGRVERCWAQGSRQRYALKNDGTVGDKLYGMMGLTSMEANDLKSAIATLEKVAPVAKDLADVTGAATLQADAGEAKRLLARAAEVLNYDYNNEGRYSKSPTGAAGSKGATGQTPTTPRTRTGYGR